MQHVWLVFFALAASLVAAGCGSGSGVSFGDEFGGGSLASFGDGGLGGEGGSGGDSIDPSNPATVHHPEPASLALFGAGLAGAAALNRRKSKARKRSS